MMSWITLLHIALQIAAYFAKRAERKDIENSILNEIKILHDEYVDAASDARANTKLPEDGSNPNQRD